MQVVQDLAESQGVHNGVATVTVDSGFDDVGFFNGEEGAPGDELSVRGAVGKVDDEDEAEQTKTDGDYPLLRVQCQPYLII